MVIKLITGFRQEQYLIIVNEEAHKGYYLFMHPEERGIFNNGVALIGKNIQGIEPAYNETMGWNPSHQLDDDDWNDIRQHGVDKELQDVLSEAKQVAQLAEKSPEMIMKPLSEAKRLLLK